MGTGNKKYSYTNDGLIQSAGLLLQLLYTVTYQMAIIFTKIIVTSISESTLFLRELWLNNWNDLPRDIIE